MATADEIPEVEGFFAVGEDIQGSGSLAEVAVEILVLRIELCGLEYILLSVSMVWSKLRVGIRAISDPEVDLRTAMSLQYELVMLK